MDLWVKISNTITIGNISAVITLILFGIYGYYKIRRYLALQHSEFIKYLQSLTVEQTAQIEACLHKIPNHPENPVNKSSDLGAPIPENGTNGLPGQPGM